MVCLSPPPVRGFLRSTRIVTLAGEMEAGRLSAGMRVLTLSGEGAPLRPVQQVRSGDGADCVRIAAGAIDDGVPIRALRVRPGHGLGVDDGFARRCVVPAGLLVNGATICAAPAPEAHVELVLEEHALVMADGMPAESTPREAAGLRPLAGAALSGVRARLLERALAAGWALTEDAALEVVADGKDGGLPRIEGGPAAPQAFRVPAGCRVVRLRSRRFVPAHTDPAGGDGRVLGVALERIAFGGTEVALDGPGFGAGFLPVEGVPGRLWRWTSGDAELRLPAGPADAVLTLWPAQGWSRYWRAPGE